MLKTKKILALITARGGSKGIPYKNIKPLGGKPLIQWTIEAALASKYIDKLVLSSDDAAIIKVASDAGCSVPFVRPQELATDTSTSMEVILHALENVGGDFDCLLLLQPTSPFRTVEHIDAMIEFAINQNADMVISIARVKKHPAYLYQLDGDNLKPFFSTHHQLRRQDMPLTYEHNGAMYFSKIDFLKRVKSYNVEQAIGYEMSGIANLDIDEQDDWDYAEYVIERGKLR